MTYMFYDFTRLIFSLQMSPEGEMRAIIVNDSLKAVCYIKCWLTANPSTNTAAKQDPIMPFFL